MEKQTIKTAILMKDLFRKQEKLPFSLRNVFHITADILTDSIPKMERLEEYEKRCFRVRYRESEQGWGTNIEYQYYDTLEEAKNEREKNLPKATNERIAPEYYYIPDGPVEQFDFDKKEWMPLFK